MKKFMSLISCFMLVVFIGGCANMSPSTYNPGEAGVASRVVHGVIVGKRAIKLEASEGNIGSVAGGVGGAVAGSAIGGSDRANILGAVGGAVLGGVVGNAAEKALNRHDGFEYIIKVTKDGSTISVAQAVSKKDAPLEVNQRVLVIYGATTRVVPDNTVQ